MLYLTRNIQICRCERSEYDRFESLHYLRGICKGAICYLFKVDNEVAAFASLLAMPMKSHTDALIFHRIVILEEFQNLGLSTLIVNLLGGIYRQNGKSLYLKTDSTKMGKMLRNNNQWLPTQMNKRTRKLSKHDHERNKARHRRAAFCYKYDGSSINGYTPLTYPISAIRSEHLINKWFSVDTDQIVKSTYKISEPEFLRDALTLDYKVLRERYGSHYENNSQYNNLYTTEYKIRRNSKNGSASYTKRLLFLNGIIYRFKPESTVEGLIYHLLLENCLQDLKMRNIEVIRIAFKVHNTDIAKYSQLKRAMPKYRVNVEVAKEQGYSPKQASNVARKQIRATRISELYNPEFTDDENIRLMGSKGLNISLSTLKRWRKENGYTKYNKSVIPSK